MTDADLVQRTLDGDSSAFTVLADRHAPSCLRFATRMLGVAEDAEEATQDALVRAYRALGRYDKSTAFRTWLFAILVNRCRTSAASRKRRDRWMQTDDALIASSIVPATGPDSELNIELARAIDLLPIEQREAFLLKYVEQLEYTEIATVTGVGVSALKMRVQRACMRLRQELHEYKQEFGGGQDR